MVETAAGGEGMMHVVLVVKVYANAEFSSNGWIITTLSGGPDHFWHRSTNQATIPNTSCLTEPMGNVHHPILHLVQLEVFP